MYKIKVKKVPEAFNRDVLYWSLNCIVVLWPLERAGLPIAILNRTNIIKNQDLKPIKLKSEYLVSLGGDYEPAIILFNGDYNKCQIM